MGVPGIVGVKRTPAAGRTYVLTSLLHCGVYQRRMQGQWNHGRAYYRCRYTEDYPGQSEHPKSIYVKEEAILPGPDRWLASLFGNEQIDATCEALAASQDDDPTADARHAELRRRLADCDRRIDGYRRVLDEGGDPATVAGWIADTQRGRGGIAAQLGGTDTGTKLSTEQVKQLVTGLRDIVTVLVQAEPADKAMLCKELGLSLAYDPDGTVNVQVEPRGVMVGVRGGT